MNSFYSFVTYLKFSWSDFLQFLNQPSGSILFPNLKKTHLVFFLFLLSIVQYINTLGHQMAFDDDQVIRKNDFVHYGVKSIPDILTHDSHYWFYKNSGMENILEGGRYRPLSIITFAMEQQLVGTRSSKVPYQLIWDVNGNGIAEPDEDTNQDHVLNADDFFNRGLGLRHFNNIILFALSVVFIFLFFSYSIKIIPIDVIFIAAAIFSVHPIHTEVVANIKGRDEILSLFFILLTALFSFRFLNKTNKFDLLMSMLFFFLALLSKEYALFLPFLIMIVLYIIRTITLKEFISINYLKVFLLAISLIGIIFFAYQYYVLVLVCILIYIFSGVLVFKFRNLTQYLFFLVVPIAIYLLLRFNATKDATSNNELFMSNIITNPYLLADHLQTWATKIYVLLKYIVLLFLPYPLSCDYSFNSIAYRNFKSPEVWFSLFIYSTLICSSIIMFLKRKPLAIPLIIYIVFLLPVANLFVNIGATIGERLVYHSSLGFCFLLAWPLTLITNYFKNNAEKMRYVVITSYGLVLLLYLSLSWNRNKEWENNETLFEADLKKFPKNMLLLSGEARNLYYKAEKITDSLQQTKLLNQSINLVDRGLRVNANYIHMYQTLALDFYLLKKYENAISSSRAGLKVDSTDFTLKITLTTISKEFIIKGISEYKKGKNENAILFFDKAIKTDNKNADAYYNKAYIFKEIGDTLSSIECLKLGIKNNPTKQQIKLLNSLYKK
jgi:tetratricopeptide (TPR) repeat protein